LKALGSFALLVVEKWRGIAAKTSDPASRQPVSARAYITDGLELLDVTTASKLLTHPKFGKAQSPSNRCQPQAESDVAWRNRGLDFDGIDAANQLPGNRWSLTCSLYRCDQ
jgi:hypothetical protein